MCVCVHVFWHACICVSIDVDKHVVFLRCDFFISLSTRLLFVVSIALALFYTRMCSRARNPWVPTPRHSIPTLGHFLTSTLFPACFPLVSRLFPVSFLPFHCLLCVPISIHLPLCDFFVGRLIQIHALSPVQMLVRSALTRWNSIRTYSPITASQSTKHRKRPLSTLFPPPTRTNTHAPCTQPTHTCSPPTDTECACV
jgi:hypothetical protein